MPETAVSLDITNLGAKGGVGSREDLPDADARLEDLIENGDYGGAETLLLQTLEGEKDSDTRDNIALAVLGFIEGDSYKNQALCNLINGNCALLAIIARGIVLVDPVNLLQVLLQHNDGAYAAEHRACVVAVATLALAKSIPPGPWMDSLLEYAHRVNLLVKDGKNTYFGQKIVSALYEAQGVVCHCSNLPELLRNMRAMSHLADIICGMSKYGLDCQEYDKNPGCREKLMGIVTQHLKDAAEWNTKESGSVPDNIDLSEKSEALVEFWRIRDCELAAISAAQMVDVEATKPCNTIDKVGATPRLATEVTGTSKDEVPRSLPEADTKPEHSEPSLIRKILDALLAILRSIWAVLSRQCCRDKATEEAISKRDLSQQTVAPVLLTDTQSVCVGTGAGLTPPRSAVAG